MGRLGRTGVAGASAMALGLTLAGTAFAHAVTQPSFTKISLGGTHGYRIEVRSTTGINKRGQASAPVDMAASKGHVEATYSTSNGKSSAKTLSADLGKYGRVDLTFHPTKTTHPKPPNGCHGSETRKTGVWKGTIKFKGEGFTSASANSANGSRTVGLFNCSGGGHKMVALNAFIQEGSDYRSFSATKLERNKAKPHFSATELEDGGGGVSIGRFAFVNGRPGDFTYNPGFTHGEVTPPGPFKGSATYDNGNWTGNLKVSLPGDKNVPLTGPGWDPSLSEVAPLKAPL